MTSEDKKVKKYRDLITEIYKEHNPSKLSDMKPPSEIQGQRRACVQRDL